MDNKTINLMKEGLEKTKGHEVTNVYAIVAIAPDGTEGIPAVINSRGMTVPLLCTSEDLIPKIKKLAIDELAGDGNRLVLRVFNNGTDVEELH